tara:strand:- start:2319 stop:2912 length:594 start_codon:yes stop_codon:yes gene_type:complete
MTRKDIRLSILLGAAILAGCVLFCFACHREYINVLTPDDPPAPSPTVPDLSGAWGGAWDSDLTGEGGECVFLLTWDEIAQELTGGCWFRPPYDCIPGDGETLAIVAVTPLDPPREVIVVGNITAFMGGRELFISGEFFEDDETIILRWKLVYDPTCADFPERGDGICERCASDHGQIWLKRGLGGLAFPIGDDQGEG